MNFYLADGSFNAIHALPVIVLFTQPDHLESIQVALVHKREFFLELLHQCLLQSGGCRCCQLVQCVSKDTRY